VNNSREDSSLFRTLEWRCIGPHRGGRVLAVAGDPVDPMVFYFGACSGGVWKTDDGGSYWENITDGFFKTAAVGAIAIANSDPNVIYMGMGEACIRGNHSHGDGVYKSTDKGKTWKHLGLEDTRHISRVRIHPNNPDLVYVAALGHAYGPNPERGVYRSRDGGKTWELVLFKSDKAGAIDLTMDPNNPRILFATIYQVQRYPWDLVSGGPDSGIHRSADGGTTWEDISDNPGLPKGIKGRIGITISPAKSERVWALIEAEDGGLFRSDDSGASWERLTDEKELWTRAWYYTHIFAHPQDSETVYVFNNAAWRSFDGGRTFSQMPMPHVDNHDLWIDPKNPQRMISGNDGGACITFNGGASWSTLYNQPTAQFYHVITDNQFPYRVYGAQQDSTTISVPSRSSAGVITQSEWYTVGGGESGYIAVRSDDPNIVYAGNNMNGQLTHYDHRTGQARNIMVLPEPAWGQGAGELKYRFQWTFPVVLSPHDSNVLYATGNHVFRSTNRGSSWEPISPDLTRNDVTKLGRTGGPITKDITGVEYYCTIFAFAESPLERGVLWAGSDDGLVHVSRDSGSTWENVTPSGLPEWAMISIIEASPHDPATAYVAATRYKLDDIQPYLYKTNDYGKTWKKITDGISEHDFTRAIREDPARRGLLYAGTETGVYVSFDDGARWQSLQLNLPVVPIHDLAITQNDLIAATHGRSFWILDDLTPLHQTTEQVAQSDAHLFKPRDTYRFLIWSGFDIGSTLGRNYQGPAPLVTAYYENRKPTGEKVRTFLDGGQNPPSGVVVQYYFKEKPEGEVTLTFLDAQGQEIKSFTGKVEDEASSDPAREPRILAEAGMNRFVWNMRYPDPTRLSWDVTTEEGFGATVSGPVAPPGAYQVRLVVGDQAFTEAFNILKDPRLPATQEQLQAQFDLLQRIRNKLSETHDSINQIRNIRQQVNDWVSRVEGLPSSQRLYEGADGLKEKLSSIEEELVQVRARGRQDNLNHPARLNAKLAGLAGLVASADDEPTHQAREVFDDLSSRVDVQLVRLRQVIDEDLEVFKNLIAEMEVPPLVPRAMA